ncbi:MAG: hypothetical protein L3J03_00615 [Desulfobacterales bacterium]|nr:hypothetical protein [Desulfobacterales bacterium]
MKTQFVIILLVVVGILSFIIGYSVAPTDIATLRHSVAGKASAGGGYGDSGGYGADSGGYGGGYGAPAGGGYGAPDAGGYGAPAAGGYGGGYGQ